MSAGHPSAQVAGGAPTERTSTLASAELLAGRGSLVSLDMLEVLEITPFGAPALTEKLSVIVAISPLAHVATEQSTTPIASEHVKPEPVLADW
jgi:hypothetical protein